MAQPQGLDPSLDTLDVEQRLAFLNIDEAVRADLRRVAPRVSQAMPALAAELYAHMGQQPKLAALLGDAAHIERLQRAQGSHWQALFAGTFDEAYFRRTLAVGRAHSTIGLEPRWYIGAYAFMLERLLRLILGRKASRDELGAIGAIIRAVFLDMDVAILSYVTSGDQDRIRTEMMNVSQLLEREIEYSVKTVIRQAERMTDGSQSLSSIATRLHETAVTVERSATTTIGNIQSVAGATEEMDASSLGIAEQVSTTTRLTETAVGQMQATDEAARGLTDATARIDEVVCLVESIAAQTKLLALNATIEAARAGEVGRGFGVVAAEVKALARQTEDAIRTIRSQSTRIQEAAQQAIAMVGGVNEQICAIDRVAAEVAQATDQQHAATTEISRSAAAAAEQAQIVGTQAQMVLAEAATTGQTAENVRQLSQLVSTNIKDLQRRITTIVRSSVGGNRRKDERYPVAVKCRFAIGGWVTDALTLNLSAGGCLIAGKADRVRRGDRLNVEMDGLGAVEAVVAGVSSSGVHTQFVGLSSEQHQAVLAIITRAKGIDAPYVQKAQDLSRRIVTEVEAAMRGGRIAKSQLFDIDYDPIANTDPQQFSAPFTPLFETVLPPIIDPVVDGDGRVVFCLATDRNGYLPVHNRKYSQPQRTNDRQWNIVNCRNKRIFDDSTGTLAARNDKPFLVQLYARDMGGAEPIMLREIDTPLLFDNQHWGNLRFAMRL